MSGIEKTFRSSAFLMCKLSPVPGISKPGWLEFPWTTAGKKKKERERDLLNQNHREGNSAAIV